MISAHRHRRILPPARRPLDESDEWGDLAAFLHANFLHKRTIPQDEVFREA